VPGRTERALRKLQIRDPALQPRHRHHPRHPDHAVAPSRHRADPHKWLAKTRRSRRTPVQR